MRLSRAICVIISAIFMVWNCNAQNIVLNGNFELYTSLPTTQGQGERAKDWQQTVLSCDYMNSTYTGWSSQDGGAFQGKGYIGFASYGSTNGASEAIGQNIDNNPIKAGIEYKVSLYAKKSNGGVYAEICGGVVIYGFPNTPPTNIAGEHISTFTDAHLIFSSATVSNTQWKQFSGKFTVPHNINFIVLSVAHVPNCRQYIYVDEVVIEPVIEETLFIGNDTNFCEGGNLTLSANIENAVYLWNTGASTKSITINAAGKYWLQTTKNNKILSDTINISVIKKPQFSLGKDTFLCEKDTLKYKFNILGANYLWSNNSTENNINITGPGKYWLTVTVNNCSFTDSVLVNNLEPIKLPENKKLCPNETLTLYATNGYEIYKWQDGSTENYYEITKAGKYWVTAKNSNCASADTIEITFYKELNGLNLGEDKLICKGEKIQLNSNISAENYLWNNGSTDSILTVYNEGKYWLKIFNNCTEITDTIIISYRKLPEVFLGNDTTLCKGKTLILYAGENGAKYLWNDGSILAKREIRQPGIYSVKVTNLCGTTEDSILITYDSCNCSVFIPNAFTPNDNNNINDFFKPIICDISNYRFLIYNRWGELLFESFNPDFGWNGYFRNTKVPEGIYIYVLQAQSVHQKNIYRSGNFYLLR